jgi:hypothetical protein
MPKTKLWSTTRTERIRGGLLAAAFAALTLMAFSATANAAVGCYGDYCSGKNPEDTYNSSTGRWCSAGAYTVASARIYGSTSWIELRWSPNCQTNWARVSSGYGTIYPWALRAVQCATGYTQAGVVASSADYSWTRMIYSPVKTVRASWTGPPGANGTACA